MMKKSYLIISIIIILIILGVGYKLIKLNKSAPYAVPCSEEYYEALEKLDVTICESVTGPTNESCRDNCIKEVAYKKGEPELCKLINPDATYALSSTVTVPVKDFCYKHLAEKLGDISLCDNVESDWVKENCP